MCAIIYAHLFFILLIFVLNKKNIPNMAMTKHASIRYEILDRCLQKRSEDNTQQRLRNLCCNAIARQDSKYEAAEISLRTFRSDIAYIKNIAGKQNVEVISRLGSEGYYYYYSRPDFSIYKNELSDSEVGQLKCAMQLLSRFKGLPEYDSIANLGAKLEQKYGLASGGQTYVEYEHVESTGEEMMAEMCDCIIKQQPIKITYMPYGKPKKEWVLHPYFLKEYNNRWFLFGYNETEGKISNTPLDRISPDYERLSRPFIPNRFIDFSTFFDNVVGVTVKGCETSVITLRASEARYPYIESKPLHASQMLKDARERIFTINVIPNRELDSLILSFGDDLEVISPDWYRDHIKQKVADVNKLYFGVQNNCIPK